MPRRFAKSARHAVKGLIVVFREERNFRLQISCAAMAILFAFILEFTYVEHAILVLLIALVFAAEIVNTLVEDLMNHVAPYQDPAVGKIKDMAAGIVLLTSIAALIGGVLLTANHL